MESVALFPILALVVLGVVAVGAATLVLVLRSSKRKALILLPFGVVVAMVLLAGVFATYHDRVATERLQRDQVIEAIRSDEAARRLVSQAQVLDYRGDTSEPVVTDPLTSGQSGSIEVISYSPSTADPHPEVPLSELPDWVSEQTEFNPDSANQRLVLSSYPKLSVEEADEELYGLLAVHAGEFLSAAYPDADGWYPARDSLEELPLIQEAVTERFPLEVSGEHMVQMQRSHWRVELTPEIRQRLFELWRPELVQQRLVQLGGGLGGLTLLFAMLAGVLRLRQRSRGSRRHTVATVAAALFILAGMSALFIA